MIAAALMTGVAACGGDDSDAPPVPTPTSTAAASGAAGDTESEITNGSKPPSIAALNELVDTAVDPDVPSKDKIVLVEGSEKDPAIFDELVKARAENSDVDWVLAGPWWDDTGKDLQAKAPQNLRITGYLSDDDLDDLFRRCGVYVQASLHEGFGMSLAEAMSRG